MTLISNVKLCKMSGYLEKSLPNHVLITPKARNKVGEFAIVYDVH